MSVKTKVMRRNADNRNRSNFASCLRETGLILREIGLILREIGLILPLV
jgi:hypothetical protein